MILLRSTHEALLKEKDLRIAGLQDEIGWLRHFLQPQARAAAPVAAAQEADAVLEGRQDTLGTDTAGAEAILSERSRLLSGTY